MKNLDVKQICAIIKTCGMCGVKHIQLDGMSVSFKDGTDVAYIDDRGKPMVDNPADVLKIEADEIEKQSNFDEMERLEELAITDPEAFEREISKGALDAEADVAGTE